MEFSVYLNFVFLTLKLHTLLGNLALICFNKGFWENNCYFAFLNYFVATFHSVVRNSSSESEASKRSFLISLELLADKLWKRLKFKSYKNNFISAKKWVQFSSVAKVC